MVMWSRTVVGCVLLCVAYLSEVCRTDMLMIRHGRSRVRHSSEKDHIRWGLKAFDNLTLDYELDSYEQNDTSEIGGSGGGNLSTVNINSSEIVYQSNGERELSGPFSTVSTSFYYNGFLSTSAATDSTTNNNYAKSKKVDTKNLTTVINDVERNIVGLNGNGNGTNVGSGSAGAPTKAPKKKLGKKQIMANIRKTVDKGLEYLKSHANLDEINIKILEDNEKQMKHPQQVTTTGATYPALAASLVKINTQPAASAAASVTTTEEKIIRNRLEIDNDDENNLRQQSEHDNDGALLKMPERSKKPTEHLYRNESPLSNWLSEIIAPTVGVAKTQIPSSSSISVPSSITAHEQVIGLKSVDNNGKNKKIHNKFHSIITGTQNVDVINDDDETLGGTLNGPRTVSAEVDMIMNKANEIEMNEELSREVDPPQQNANHKRMYDSQTTRGRFSHSNMNINNKKKRNKIANRKNEDEDINNYNYGSMVKEISVSDGSDIYQQAEINHYKEDNRDNLRSFTLKPPTVSTDVTEEKLTNKGKENSANDPYLDSGNHVTTINGSKMKHRDSFQQEEQTKFVKIFRPDEIETYFNHTNLGDNNLEENFDSNGNEKYENHRMNVENGMDSLKPSGLSSSDDEDGDESFFDGNQVNESGVDGDNSKDNTDSDDDDNTSQNIDDVLSNGFEDRSTFNEDLKNIFRMEDIDLLDLDETSRNNRLNLMKGEDVVTKFLQIVESQHLLGANCTAGTALNLGEGVVDRYAQDRFRVEAEVAVNRANMLTRIFKLTSPAVQASEHLLHASVLSMVEFDDDIFAAGNCFDWNQHPLKKGLFCPFAYRLPPPEQGASLAKDLAAEYHYLGNTSEWFFLARKNAEKVIARNEQYIKAYHLYANSTTRQADEILSVKYEDGRWSKPYYDCGGGNIWMLTYTVPFFGYENGTYFFKGTSGIDIDLRRVDIDQCPQRNTGSAQPLNIFAGTDKCKQRTTECKPIPGLGFRRGSYKCVCRRGFYFPDTNIPQKYFNGSTLEEEYEKLMLRELSMYKIPATYECLPCAEGCDSCMDASPCVAALNWPMRTSILVLACAVIGLLPPAALFTFRYQQVKVVRAASPALLRVIALGAFFIYCTSIVMYPPPSIYACTARVWLREIGFSLTYGALMLKTWRISVIFRVRSAKAVKITDAALLKRLGILCCAVGAALLVRTIVAPPFVVVGRTADNLKAYLCRTDWWDHTFTSMEVLFLAWGVRLCIMVRKAPSEFNESRFISMAIYNEFLLTCFLNVSMLFLQSPANPDLLYIIFFCHTQLTVTLLLALIFGSKVYMVFRGGGKPPEDALGLGAKSSAPKFNFRSQGRSMGNPSTATSSTAQFGAHMGTDVRLTEQEALEEIRQMCSQLQRLQDRVPPRGVAVATISALLESCRASHPLTLKPPLLSITAAKMNDVGVKHVDKSTNTNTCCCDDKTGNWSQINNGGIARIAITDVTDKTSLQNNNIQQQQELKQKLIQLQLVQSSEKLNQNISNSASSTSVSTERKPAGDGCGRDTSCAIINKCEKPSKCINKKKSAKCLIINDGGGSVSGCGDSGNNEKKKVCTYQDNNDARHCVTQNIESIETKCNLDFANLQLECMCSAANDDFHNSEDIINATNTTNSINISNDNVIEKHQCCLNNYKHCKNGKFLNLDDDNNKYVKTSVSCNYNYNNNNVSNNKISGSNNNSLSSTNNNQMIADDNINYCDDGNVVRCDISNNCSSTTSSGVTTTTTTTTTTAAAAAAYAGNTVVTTASTDYIGDNCGCGYNYNDNNVADGATSTITTADGGGCIIHSSNCCYYNKKNKQQHHHHHLHHHHHHQYNVDNDNDDDDDVNCAFVKKNRDETVNKLNKINLCDKMCENFGDNNIINKKKMSKNSIDNKIINLNEVIEDDTSNDNDNDDVYSRNSKLYDDTSSVIVQLSDGDDDDDDDVDVDVDANAGDTVRINVAVSDDNINARTTNNIRHNQNVNNKTSGTDNCASCSWQFLDSLDNNLHTNQVTNDLVSDAEKLSNIMPDINVMQTEHEHQINLTEDNKEADLEVDTSTATATTSTKKRAGKSDGSGRLVLDLNDRSKYTKEVSV